MRFHHEWSQEVHSKVVTRARLEVDVKTQWGTRANGCLHFALCGCSVYSVLVLPQAPDGTATSLCFGCVMAQTHFHGRRKSQAPFIH